MGIRNRSRNSCGRFLRCVAVFATLQTVVARYAVLDSSRCSLGVAASKQKPFGYTINHEFLQGDLICKESLRLI